MIQITTVTEILLEDFETLFLRYQAPITKHIYHRIDNREQAYDLAQDVFIKAYRSLRQGTVVPQGAFAAWLYRIADNTTTDYWRRKKLIMWIPLSLFSEDRAIGAGMPYEGGDFREDDNGGSGSQALMALPRNTRGGYGTYDGGVFENKIADRELIEKIFGQISSKYSVCLWLFEHDGLSCAEIASMLQISISSVKMRLMRGRQQFVQLYQQEIKYDSEVNSLKNECH